MKPVKSLCSFISSSLQAADKIKIDSTDCDSHYGYRLAEKNDKQPYYDNHSRGYFLPHSLSVTELSCVHA